MDTSLNYHSLTHTHLFFPSLRLGSVRVACRSDRGDQRSRPTLLARLSPVITHSQVADVLASGNGSNRRCISGSGFSDKPCSLVGHLVIDSR